MMPSQSWNFPQIPTLKCPFLTMCLSAVGMRKVPAENRKRKQGMKRIFEHFAVIPPRPHTLHVQDYNVPKKPCKRAPWNCLRENPVSAQAPPLHQKQPKGGGHHHALHSSLKINSGLYYQSETTKKQ